MKKAIVWCNKEELIILSDRKPITGVRKPLPSDTLDERKDKAKKPYINRQRVIFVVRYLGEEFVIPIQKNYTWDGATIPFGFRWIIGAKGSPKFLNPSLLHDIITEKKSLLKYDRQLSSICFRELLIASGVCKFKAYIMYYAVDLFQKYFCNWKKVVE